MAIKTVKNDDNDSTIPTEVFRELAILQGLDHTNIVMWGLFRLKGLRFGMADLRQARKPDQKKKRGKTVTVWNNKFIHFKQKKNA